MRLYACGYTESENDPGVWLFDLEEGLMASAVGAQNPSYGAMRHMPDGRLFMYASCELEDCARLARYEIDGEGIPRYIDERSFEGASGTCFVLVDPRGRCVYGADYNSGSICQCELGVEGNLGNPWPLVQDRGHGPERESGDPNFDRQTSAHVHTLSFVPGTPYVAAVDLGLDRIYLYEPKPSGEIGAADRIGEVEVPSGCGPRIIAYHPTLPIAALVCELSCEVLIYAISDDGLEWTLLGRRGLIDGHPADWAAPDASAAIPKGEYPPLAAHAEFSRVGRFLYVSTRGTNTMTIFEVDPCGKIAEIETCSCGGHSPRHFAISPNQQFLAVANQVSDEVAVFKRDEETGALAELTRLSCHQPSCVIWE